LASFISGFTLFAITDSIKQEKAMPFPVKMNRKKFKFIEHLRFLFMSLANSADFQFSLDEPFEVRLFTRRTDLSNDIQLLKGTNAVHAMLNRAWGTMTQLADEYGIHRIFISLQIIGQFF
jgi:hypothetical protein